MGKFIYSFNEGAGDLDGLLGEKGAALAEMTRIGLPVPFGFTVTTETCARYFEDKDALLEDVSSEFAQKIEELETVTDKSFGDKENPLLLSVRCGCLRSMSMRMEAVLNLGLNDETVEGLAKKTGNPRFAYDCYRRLIQRYAVSVMGIANAEFDSILERYKETTGAVSDTDLTAEELQGIVEEYKTLVQAVSGKVFPQAPQMQLLETVCAMFHSGIKNGAHGCRIQHDRGETLTTSVIVQAMVFGNLGESSCAGAAFTRNPASGENQLYGEFLVNAQGKDVADGLRTPNTMKEMATLFPAAYQDFARIAKVLESHYKDIQEIEFVIEQHKLYMLGAKAAARTAVSAVKAAVDMVEQNLISKETAILRVDPARVEPLLWPRISDAFATILSWADEVRTLKVRANADSEEEARLAAALGAEGIGLCRTEHMFSAEERKPLIRQLILAESCEERSLVLDRLLPYQKADFKAIYTVMEDKPVTIRLLDPSLRALFPQKAGAEELQEQTAEVGAAYFAQDAPVWEFNPLLGHRGCRLAVTYPEIAEMQTTAVIEAAIEVMEETGIEIVPEIMIPLTGMEEEMVYVKDLVVQAAERCRKRYASELHYYVGTMIEVPRAALVADRIAEEADFFSFGTNDLTQMTYGFSKDDTGKLLETYLEKGILEKNPLKTIDRDGVGKLMETAVKLGRQVKPNLKLGICGDHGGDPESIAFCDSLGLGYVSCVPVRVPAARIAAAQAVLVNRKN